MKRINVKGAIVSNDEKWVYEWLEMDATCPNDVIAELEKANGEDVVVSINSPGGDVWSASEIFTELKAYSGNVTTQIIGVGASAASVITMAGSPAKMSPTAELMIHNASMVSIGDDRHMDQSAEMLRVTNKAVAAAYETKTGLSQEELLELMNAETWMDAKTAKEKGFIDEIMFEDEPLRVVASTTGALPQSVINKIKTDALKQPQQVNADDLEGLFAQMEERISASVITQLTNKLEKEPSQKPENKTGMQRFFFNLK